MKLEPRNGLRPVTAKTHNEKYVVGYFHGFFSEGSTDDGIGTYAVIELENGKIDQFDAFKIKFEDVGEE